jgi:hypothetical protein
MISRKGMTTEVLVPAILILVVILLSLVAFTSGKIPRTFEDFRNLTQRTVRLWEKVTGADEEKLLEEKQAQFGQSYLGLVEAYRTCFSKKKNSCFCTIPDVEHLGFEDHFVSVEQHGDQEILFQPLTYFEGNAIVVPPGPQLVPGRLCAIWGSYGSLVGRAWAKIDPYKKDYPSSLQLQLNSEHPSDYVEMTYSSVSLILGSSFYKFHSLDYNASVVCFVHDVYSISFPQKDKRRATKRKTYADDLLYLRDIKIYLERLC